MELEDIQIGAWIIWDKDTYPIPRQICKKVGMYYEVSGLEDHSIPYDKDNNSYIIDYDDLCTQSQLKSARLCKENEIPQEFKINSYEIY